VEHEELSKIVEKIEKIPASILRKYVGRKKNEKYAELIA